MMRKTNVALVIAAILGRHNHIQNYHVRPVFTCGGRRYGKTYAARQQGLITDALQLSAGATLRLLHVRRKQPLTELMVSYDPASGADQSVECVFWRDPDTGALTLLSAENSPRQLRNSPWFYFDEWAWRE